MLKVLKFGGSSLADVNQFKKVKAIVEADERRNVIVVSAIGKSNKDDHKVTDLLYLCYAHIQYKMETDSIFQIVKDKYLKIEKDLGIDANIKEELKLIEDKMKSGIDQDYLVSRGEYLAAKIMAKYLNYYFVDAKDLIAFNYDGSLDNTKIKKQVEEVYKDHKKIVVPGFYGAYQDGNIHLLSRGGSDVTGSILASALNASLYENWTDVSGFYVTDPKIVDNPKQIQEISYAELRELSYMGANVLHEDTIFPILDLDIPINVLNTNRPEDKGTIISANPRDTKQIITGVTGKKNYSSITIIKYPKMAKNKVIKLALDILDKYQIEVEHMPSSIDTFSLIVDDSKYHNHLYEAIADLKKLEEVEDVIFENDIALIAIVGRNMATKAGISAKVFSVFGSNNINIKVIAQASQELSIIVGVKNNEFEKAIRAIYDALVQND